jgi:hypothetical protein
MTHLCGNSALTCAAIIAPTMHALLQERLRASSERTEEECASLSAGEKCSDTLILLSAYNIGKVSF